MGADLIEAGLGWYQRADQETSMRIGIIGLTGALTLTACGPPSTPSDDMTRSEAVAAVEDAQVLPPDKVQPEPILFADIEAEDLFGASCVFMPEGSSEMVALAMEEVGAIKLDGKILRLAPDTGSGKLPYDIHEKFDGLAWSIAFELKGEGDQSGAETTDYPAHFTLRDSSGQVSYEAEGTAQCGV
ncbi:hypothetical protein N8940_02070 [Sphingomonadaceae bacterium]|nr:hypothetical protein [Sphingomonadaceae bacterium]